MALHNIKSLLWSSSEKNTVEHSSSNLLHIKTKHDESVLPWTDEDIYKWHGECFCSFSATKVIFV